MTDLGPLLASGRDADIYEFGPGLVLRRSRVGRSMEHEARIMEYVAGHGYPVPAVHELRANGSEIVMERVDGPLMTDVMVWPPWKLAEQLRLLADLHDRLHEIPAPDWFRQLTGGGDRVVHLDLHPLNVIISARGPVVIDWPNTHRGDPLQDVALTYVLLTCPRMPGSALLRAAVRPVRPLAGRMFARRYQGPALDALIAEAAELKCFDENMFPDEIATMRRLAAKKTRASEAG